MGMFCHQCEEAAKGTGCTVRGVCGKDETVSNLQDVLLYALKGLAYVSAAARKAGVVEAAVAPALYEGLFATITNANFDKAVFVSRIRETVALREELKKKLAAKGVALPFKAPAPVSFKADTETEMLDAWSAASFLAIENADVRALRSLVIFGLKGMAAYVEHAENLGKSDAGVNEFMERALAATIDDGLDAAALTALVLETGKYGVDAMALLDGANTSAYGNPEPTVVQLGVRNNPGILISGHDLKDLEELLEQTDGTGVDVYPHGEMLPAHYYPAFKKYKNFVGNYGNAWWKQVEEIEALQRKGENLSTMAILVRAGFQTREFEERLITTGVPYRVIGGPRFYERQEIRDAMAYLRLVNSPDDGLAFERIVNTPKRGLGDAALQNVHATARARSLSLFEAARLLVETDELKPKPRKALAGFCDDVLRWRDRLETTEHALLTQAILDESGYIAMWQNDKSPEAPGRVENLKELVRALGDYDSLQTFLEHVALVMENDERSDLDKVTIMTLHGAKGLEFDSVFLPGWEEGVFPHQRAVDEGGDAGLEEERRLAYVGLTRARRRVLVTFAANRRIYNQWQTALPSRFLSELPDQHVERQAERGLFAGGNSSAAWNSGGPQGGAWRKPAAEGTSWQVAARDGGGDFAVGDRVFHQKFGNGFVVAVDGDKLEIDFDKAGRKKVLGSFVEAV